MKRIETEHFTKREEVTLGRILRWFYSFMSVYKSKIKPQWRHLSNLASDMNPGIWCLHGRQRKIFCDRRQEDSTQKIVVYIYQDIARSSSENKCYSSVRVITLQTVAWCGLKLKQSSCRIHFEGNGTLVVLMLMVFRALRQHILQL